MKRIKKFSEKFVLIFGGSNLFISNLQYFDALLNSTSNNPKNGSTGSSFLWIATGGQPKEFKKPPKAQSLHG